MDSAVPFGKPSRWSADCHAFSLVEVCLALGIVAFALIPLVGLLSVGLDSYRNSNIRGRAAQEVNQIARCIQLATPVLDQNGSAVLDPDTSKPEWTAAAPFQAGSTNTIVPIYWSLDKKPTTASAFVVYFDENGQVVASAGTAQSVAVVVVTGPTSSFESGKAEIAVAWPANPPPNPPYNAAKVISFTAPQGHEDTTISFVHKTP